MTILTTLDRAVAAILRLFVIFALVVVLILITLGVVVRVVPVFSMSGYDEVIEFLVAWMTFAGTVAIWRQGALFRVDLTAFIASAGVVRAINVLTQALMLLFAVVFTVKGWQFAEGSIETMPFLFISKTPWYAAMPVCGALMVIYGIVGLVGAMRGNPENESATLAAP